MKNLFCLCSLLFFLQDSNITAQEDWKLPLRKGKVQFEFNSKELNSGKTDLCEFYTATNTSTDLNAQLRNAMTKGKVKFFFFNKIYVIPNTLQCRYEYE
jgi:hypothetical protein